MKSTAGARNGEPPPGILLGGEVIALSVARSLSAAGIPVYALGHRADPVRHSRHRVAFADCGSGEAQQHAYMDWLESGPRRGVVLPCADDGLELIARHRARLSELGYSALEADDDVVLTMLDKARTYELARRIGIEAPRTAPVSSAAEARAAADEIGYPCALKPLHSHIFARHYGLLQKLFVVDSATELDARLADTQERGIEMLITELIPGPDWSFQSYYTYLDAGGEPLLHLTKRKLRCYPPRFGLGSYQLTDWDPEVAELGLRFLQGAGVRGLACVEFKRDARDERLKLIECNHRFTGATEQLHACGMDVALLAYSRLAGTPAPPLDGYRTGVGFWYPLRDARAFVAYRRTGELTFGAWVRSLIRPVCFPVARLSDPLPSLVRGARLFVRLARALAPGSDRGARPKRSLSREPAR